MDPCLRIDPYGLSFIADRTARMGLRNDSHALSTYPRLVDFTETGNLTPVFFSKKHLPFLGKRSCSSSGFRSVFQASNRVLQFNIFLTTGTCGRIGVAVP